jgi:outer membrane receptor for ferrienterochelin and colicins
MSNKLYVAIIIAANIIYSHGLLADDGKNQVSSEIDQSSVEKITVTGQRASSGLIDAPTKVEIIDEKTIRELQHQLVSQAIQEIPGVGTSTISRRASGQSALIQGFGENSVLVMIDGTPVSQSSSFGFDLNQISTADIARIEVIKGGASALYGSQAIGGVINVVSKRPSEKSQIQLEVATQEDQNQNAKLFVASRIGENVGVKINGSLIKQEEIDQDSSSITTDSPNEQHINGSVEVSAELGKSLIIAKHLVLNSLNTNNSSRPYSSNGFGPSVTQTKTTTHNSKLTIEHQTSNGELKAIYNRDDTNDRLILNDNPFTVFSETAKQTNHTSHRYDLSWQNIMLGDHDITMGLLYKNERVDQTTTTQVIPELVVTQKDIDNKELNNLEGFIQDNFSWKDFEISPGLRVQKHNQFDLSYTPKLNVSYFDQIGNWDLKSWVTIGSGYRTPTVKERFFTLDHSSVANYLVIGNEDLDAEESLNFQVGQEFKYNRKFSLYVNYFNNYVTNLIETTETEPQNGTRVFTYNNIESVISRGVELGMKWTLTDKLKLQTNYTYTVISNTATDLILPNRPLYSGRINLFYEPTRRLQFILQNIYRGSTYQNLENTQTQDGFILNRLKANYKYSKTIDLFASLNNIFDVKQDPAQDLIVPAVDQRPALGRNIFFGLRTDWEAK